MEINLGFAYAPESIRARLNGTELEVAERDPERGLITVRVPPATDGELSLDYARRVFQGSGPRRTRVIGIANACIYCGATTDLSDEHIIPFALEGEFVLRSASCQTCAAKTSRIERKVLRDALLAPRTALNLRTRRPAERPTTLPMIVDREGVRTLSSVPVAEHPTHLALPVFDLPAVLRGDTQPHLRIRGVRVIPVGAPLAEVASQQPPETYVGIQASLDIYSFARMLAKIAHGFASAADLEDVEALLPIPLFAEGEEIGRWVGGAPDTVLGADGLHEVATEISDGLVLVRVRLFAQFGGPEYLVVAGRLIKPSPDAQPIATIETRD